MCSNDNNKFSNTTIYSRYETEKKLNIDEVLNLEIDFYSSMNIVPKKV